MRYWWEERTRRIEYLDGFQTHHRTGAKTSIVHYGRSTTVVGGMFSRFSLGGKDKKEEKESPSKGRASMQSVSSDTVDFNAMLDNSFLASTL
jgi:hypothetical protein